METVAAGGCLEAANLLNAAGVLLHGDLLCRVLKAKERLNIQTGRLCEAGPVFIVWVNLRTRAET